MTTLIKVEKRDAQAQTDIQKLTQRKSEIETEIAARWGGDTTQLEVEYSGVEARLRASQIVLSNLAEERAEAQRAADIREAEKADKEHRAACTKLMKADDELREAFLSLIQQQLATYKAAHATYTQTFQAALTTHDAARRAGADLGPVYTNDVPMNNSSQRELLPTLEVFWQRLASGKQDLIW